MKQGVPYDDSIHPKIETADLRQETVIETEIGEPEVVEATPPRPQWLQLEPEIREDEVEHCVSEFAKLSGDWSLAGASARGKLHAHRALWREDAFAWSEINGWKLIVVSDGAGSAPLSRVGSNLVVQSAKAQLEKTLGEWTLESEEDLTVLRAHLVEAAQKSLEDLRTEAARREKSVNDFAATLLVVVIGRCGETDVFGALQVGDGALALWSSDETLTLLGVADHGEHSAETRFLTTSGIESELASRVVFSMKEEVCALAVMTDGISDDFFPEAKRLGALFADVLPVLKTEEDKNAALLQWMSYEKKGSSDDRTLVVLWKD